MREEIRRAIDEVVDSGSFSGGSFVEDFENDFADYCGTKYAVGVGSGTDALWLAMLAMGVGPGDEVITVPMTFFATAEAITMTGAKPVFVDIDERTYTMDPSAVGNAVTSRTKAIIPVHLFGQPAAMDAINRMAAKYGIPVIEDASQAHGAVYKGCKAGSLGNAGCFSFYPAKNLGAMGEGGAVVTDNEDLATKLRVLRNHGQALKNHHSIVGWNSRMDSIQAAVLRVKLGYLDQGNQLRREHARKYEEAFSSTDGIITPWRDKNAEHVYHVYALQVRERLRLIETFTDKGIGYGVHYPVPIHLQPAYADLGYRKGDFPVSEQCADRFISIPMFPELNDVQIEVVIEAVKEVLIPCKAA